MKTKNPSLIDSSATLFSLLTAFLISWGLSIPSQISLWVLFGFAVATITSWYLMKILYSPGYAIIIYALVFLLIPLIYTYFIDKRFVMLEFIIITFMILLTGLLEHFYEVKIKKMVRPEVLKPLIAFDKVVDQKATKLRGSVVASNESIVILLVICVLLSYLVLTYAVN